MSRRGRGTRAVSPDIASFGSVGKRNSSRNRKNQTDNADDQPAAEINELGSNLKDNIGNLGEGVENLTVKTDIQEEGKTETGKKKRGRPKKASILTTVPTVATTPPGSPDINPSSFHVTDLPMTSTEVETPEAAETEYPKPPLHGDISPDINNYPVDEHTLENYSLVKEESVIEEITELTQPTQPGVELEQVKPMEVLSNESKLDAKMEENAAVITEGANPSSFLVSGDIFGRKYEPGFIPGLDITPSEEFLSKENEQLSFGSIMAKKIFESDKNLEKELDTVVAVEEKEDDADQKIRRSSRIKSLESGRSRRREVVFSSRETLSTASSRSHSVADDDDSNSLHDFEIMSSPMREDTFGRASGTSSPVMDEGSMRDRPSSDGSSKPLKVKSRWRYSVDAESSKVADGVSDVNWADHKSTIGSLDNRDPLTRPITPPVRRNLLRKPGHIVYEAEDDELTEKLKKFDGIDDSIFFTERKISKESKYMVCDCYLSKDDIMRGEIGCNEDCLNRLLMVECGSRCPTGDRCTNKKFQRKEYCKLEVFKTEKKGHGLRTLAPLPAGGFVIEYVGEVLNPRGFTQRTKEYAKEKQEHFYFMALTSDTIIDATLKGNCSRFINHSCDPNCETQKWTVNGELRIGFFASRDLQAGEEITFDYQFQRYGKKAQKCFCMAEKCRGWIGGDEEEEEEDEDGENKEPEVTEDYDFTEALEKKPKVKVPRRRKKRVASSVNEFGDRFNEELLSLEQTGLKNKNHTLTLCRLMVRAEDWEARDRILSIIINGDQACRRLFLDYRGLRLLYGWMSTLPLPSLENGLSDETYHLKFLTALRALPIPNMTLLKDSQILTLVEKWSEVSEPIQAYNTGEHSSSAEVVSMKSDMIESSPSITEVKDTFGSETATDAEAASADYRLEEGPRTPDEPYPTGESSIDYTSVVETPAIKSWDFVETSKRLLGGWSELKEVFRIPKKERVEQMKEHEREADQADTVQTEKEKEMPAHERDRSGMKPRKLERRLNLGDFIQAVKKQGRMSYSQFKNMSKEEKRILFAKHVAKIEQEQQQRAMQENMVTLHQSRCKRMNLDPATTPIVDPSGSYYLEPSSISWKEINPEDPNLPDGLLLLVHAALYPDENPIPAPQEEQTEVSFPPWPEVFPPPPPLPPPILPSGWAISFDDQGRIYFYHARTQLVQWEVPGNDCVDFCDQSSTSDSSEEEDMEVNDESFELASDENTAPKVDVDRVSKAEERRERRKLSGLVQERIISPRSEEDKPTLTQKTIRARKLELMAERMHGFFYEEDDERDASGEAEQSSDASSSKYSRKSGSPSRKKRKTSSKLDSSSNLTEKSGSGSLEDLSQFDESGDNSMHKEERVTSPTGATGISEPNPDAPVASSSHPSIRVRSHDRKKSHKKSKKPPEKAAELPSSGKRSKDKKSQEDAFRGEIASLIVQYLNPYRKSECTTGRITSTEHFKHLARKLTHMVTTKEIKHCKTSKTGSTGNLEVNDSVKHKAKEFVRKYMARFQGREYVPSPESARTSDS